VDPGPDSVLTMVKTPVTTAAAMVAAPAIIAGPAEGVARSLLRPWFLVAPLFRACLEDD
jgi:hypothetical protein